MGAPAGVGGGFALATARYPEGKDAFEAHALAPTHAVAIGALAPDALPTTLHPPAPPMPPPPPTAPCNMVPLAPDVAPAQWRA